MNEQKNLLLFIFIFFAVMVGWHFFYDAPKPQQASQDISQGADQFPSAAMQLPQVPKDREQALAESSRVMIDTPSLRGSINLIGARLDDLTLEKYHQTTEPFSKNIELLSPVGSPEPYFIESGWTSIDTAIVLPNEKTVWRADRDSLTQTSGPVTLTWDNGQGITFERRISVDENYLFTVEQRVINKTEKNIELFPYSQVRRIGTPEVQGYFILHEGPLGYIGGSLKEHKYKDLKGAPEIKDASEGGWIGITDKYWLAALIPNQQVKSEFYFKSRQLGPTEDYVTGYYGSKVAIAPGQTLGVSSHVFAGAKVLSILDGYEAQLGVKHFDYAVDFGWFYFITKPLFYLLEILYKWLGNFGIAIMLLTVLIKLLFFPLANKSYRSMARMKELQPKMEQLKKRFSEDKMRMNQELMNLYKKEKVNPAAGCLPILIQIPVFFALYKVLFVTIEMRQAPFYGWIHDLSAPDPTTLFNLFGLIPWDPPSFLMIGILPILMGSSMWLQQKLNPAPTDPIQQKMFMVMPLMLTVLLARFPAGLVIYWTWNNILSIAQQWVIMKSAKKAKVKKR